MSKAPLSPGESYGLSGTGFPPLSIVRRDDGSYEEQRLTDDLRDVVYQSITEAEAIAAIEADQC